MVDKEKIRLHAIIEGRVQGVSFRDFVADKATQLNLYGWVRNLWNGNVEVTAEGYRQDLDRLLEKLRVGPPMANVSGVNIEWQPYSGEFSDFRVRSNSN